MKSDEQRFAEAVRKLLKTPPKPKEKPAPKGGGKNDRADNTKKPRS